MNSPLAAAAAPRSSGPKRRASAWAAAPARTGHPAELPQPGPHQPEQQPGVQRPPRRLRFAARWCIVVERRSRTPRRGRPPPRGSPRRLPVLAERAHRPTLAATLVQQPRQRGQAGPPGAGRRGAGGVVQQDGAAAGQPTADGVEHRLRGGRPGPVPPPAAPEHRFQPSRRAASRAAPVSTPYGGRKTGAARAGDRRDQRPRPGQVPQRGHRPAQQQVVGAPSRAPPPRARRRRSPGRGPATGGASRPAGRRWPAPGGRPARRGTAASTPGSGPSSKVSATRSGGPTPPPARRPRPDAPARR